jgi:eukaryotic-like serine/threonine-protein kinase
MGEVFLADDHQLGRKVAIKFLGEALDSDQTARERLLREARSAAALDHPYICKIYDLADIDGRTGIVMEHVSGETAQARLRRGPLAPREALAIGNEIAEALEEAHKRRVVHRDLKPSNVMLTEQGHVKVMDFGLAKQIPSSSGLLAEAETIAQLTASGVRIGTPAYMAPEQILGGEADERSDIFAFGILLYELLASVHPFTRSSLTGTMAAILREAPAPVSQYAKGAPDAARVVLDRLLAKEPQHRYQSFREVRTDLGQLLQDASRWTAVPQPAPTVESSSVRRTPRCSPISHRPSSCRPSNSGGICSITSCRSLNGARG